MLPQSRSAVLSSAACLVLSLLGACSEAERVGPTAPEFGTITGYITDDFAIPLSGVKVVLNRSGLYARETTSGAGGQFTFTNVETGNWILIYELPLGFVLMTHGINPRYVAVTANHETVVPPLMIMIKDDRVVPAPQFGAVSGYVFDNLDGIMAGVIVRLSRPRQPDLAVYETRSGGDGGFAFTRVESGGWIVTYVVPRGFVLARPLTQRSIWVAANLETAMPPFRFNDHPVTMTERWNDLQVAKLGEKVPYAYYTAPRGTSGAFLASVPIRWAVVSGGGSIEAAPNVEEAFQGVVHTLGPSLGPQTVTATATTIPGAPVVTFTATAVNGVVTVLGCSSDHCGGHVHEPALSPASIQIAAGQTIGWRWDTEFIHNIVFEGDTAEPLRPPAEGEGPHIRKFDQPTTIRYRCTVHSESFTSGMVGTVVVN